MGAVKRYRLSKQVWERQKDCFYCGKRMVRWGKNKPTKFTLEHLTPKSRGGDDSLENLVGACWQCNHRRGNKSIKEFADKVPKKEIKEVCSCEKPTIKRLGKDYICILCKRDFKFKD